MRRLALILIFILLNTIASMADNTFPYSYSKFEFLQGGQVVVTGMENKYNQPMVYFIKPNWTEEAESLYYWKGFKRRNPKGVATGSSYIIANYPLKNSILSIWRDGDRFFISDIDSTLEMKTITEIKSEWKPYLPVKASWIGKTALNEYCFILNASLFLCRYMPNDQIILQKISDNVIAATSLYDSNKTSNYKLAYLVFKETSGIVNFLRTDNLIKFSARIPVSDNVSLQSFKQQAAIIAYSKSYPNSLIKIIDPERGVVSETWIVTSGDKIRIDYSDKTAKIFYLVSNNQQYFLKIYNYSNKQHKIQNPIVEIPPELIEPTGLWIINKTIYALFRNGLATIDFNGKILSIDFFPFGEFFTDKISLSFRDKYLILSSRTSSLILLREEHQWWYFNRFLANFGRILFPTLLIIIIILLFIFYRRQKALLEAVLNLPASGAVFIIDKYGRLKRANSSGKKLLGITDSIPMRRMFRYYCELQHTKPIIELVDKAITTRDTFTQKLNIVKANDMYEWIFNVISLRNATGGYRGFVLTGIDITEQLERKRLSNWAQLAHDMQTNLSTIRLNAEQFDTEDGTNNANRRKKIIHQVGLLIQRVRDVVTVGRSDAINKETVDTYDICYEVRSEFDEAVFPHVSFSVEAEHFNIACDKPKMIRAVRNAVENGIKSMQGQSGSIKITNWHDTKFAYIGVQDTGPGMDEKTMKKMLTPYFTTAKKSGGAGIGTMIMQHVMELHGGEIKVKSELGIGTQIIFCIPIYTQKKSNNK